MKVVGFLILALAIAIGSVGLNAFTLATLWEWYICTGFGIAPVGMMTAFGVSLIVRFLTYTHVERDEDASLASTTCLAIGPSLGALFVGWIGTLFM